jgi:hypothetical protein
MLATTVTQVVVQWSNGNPPCKKYRLKVEFLLIGDLQNEE